MAQTLNGDAGIGHNGHTEIGTQDEYLDLLKRYEDAEGDLASARATCREPAERKRKIKADIKKKYGEEGWDAFERAMKDANRSSTSREREAQLHAAMLAWQRKPLNFQSILDFQAPPMQFSTVELERIEADGFKAGQAGEPAQLNSFVPGSEAFARWQDGWTRGQTEKVETEIEPKRGRGRPRKDGSPAQPRVARGARAGKAGGRGRGGGRTRTRKSPADDALDRAREHLGGEGGAETGQAQAGESGGEVL